MPVKTVEARVLLGWMEQDQAVRCLREDCYFDPVLSDEAAGTIWRGYKDTVDGLPERPLVAHQRIALTNAEKTAENQFRRLYNHDPNINAVIKVNPMDLQVHQLYVVTEISDGYAERVKGNGWIDTALLGRRNSQFRIRGEGKSVIYEFPHGEFQPLIVNGTIGIREGASFASLSLFENRLILGTGYHRTFAYSRNAMNVPDAIGKAAVFPLLRSLPFPDSPDAPNHGLRGVLLGTRAPRFADFFDGRLFMSVGLRKKKHYELRVNFDLVGIDDDAP